jgi:hypothetical protein
MGANDWSARGDNSFGQALEFLEEAFDSKSRTGTKRATSFRKRTSFSFMLLTQSFLREFVEFAGMNITFNLAVPLGLMSFNDPFGDFPELTFRQFFDGALNILHRAHSSNVTLPR